MKILLSITTVLVCFACKTSKQSASTVTEKPVDPVCGMRVDRSDAFTSKYNGTTYYFDSYECEQSFKMNPERFINQVNAKAK